MTCYLSPVGLTNQEWLVQNARLVPFPRGLVINAITLLVCLFDTEAIICIDVAEMNSAKADQRAKSWHIATRVDLREASDLASFE